MCDLHDHQHDLETKGDFDAVFRINGSVERSLELTYEDLQRLPPELYVKDIGVEIPGVRGEGIRLKGILEVAKPEKGTKAVTVRAGNSGYTTNLSLEEVRDHGILLYQRDGEPLPVESGGPIRLYIPGDAIGCSNVKCVGLIHVDAPPSQQHDHDHPHDHKHDHSDAHDHDHSHDHDHEGHKHHSH